MIFNSVMKLSLNKGYNYENNLSILEIVSENKIQKFSETY